MSEPIQSISNGNYILQGTVATSAGIVGDGSTQNPLRADETLLYSAASPTQIIKNQVSAFQLSESIANFDRLRLNFIHSYGYGTYQFCNSVDVTIDPTHTGQDGVADIWKYNSFYDENKFTLSENTLTISGDGRYKISVNGTAAADNTARGAALQSVIGINRIANN